ncbi:pentapeptide repeat-containing protein [Pedococcus ginsenosidimutans]|uniref:Pentapeptide repeat-containing protein n=1 Tax=Pedococcus ginsenosidimutans TaxID=490570 RepID=A0ABP8XMP5_9MICO
MPEARGAAPTARDAAPTARGAVPEVELVADCSRCSGLCCVVPAFSASADFAIDKPAATPCPNLGEGFGCRIHAELRPRGFAGCTAYDCFGAGQRVSQVTFGGVDWRAAPDRAPALFAAFTVVRELHELRSHLGEARRLVAGTPLGREAELLDAEVEAAAGGAPDELARVDLASLGGRTGELLGRVSAAVRAPGGQDLARADLVGADLRVRDLRSATLRGALLLGADLRGCVLDRTDLLGADLRGSRLHGADLSGALFLTRPQVGAALGDGSTVLPPDLPPPSHWAA